MQSSHPSILKVEKLSHRYGIAWAIRDINFEISQHGIVGLLGSNGAGKSTTMNILSGVLNQTEGHALIDGIDVRLHPQEAKRRLGFLPQTPPLHLDFTVDEYLTHCAHLRLIPRRQVPAAVKAAKELCGIAAVSRRLMGNLSGGYRQRCGIAQAVIHRPKLVVLDEPTNGLDPNQILEVRALIKDIAADRAILFSTHILTEVHATCNRVIMIENGQMVFSDTLEVFNNYLEPRTLVMRMKVAPDSEVLKSMPGIVEIARIDTETIRVTFNGSHDIAERLIERSVAEGWHLQEIHIEKNSLESVFKHLSKESRGQQS